MQKNILTVKFPNQIIYFWIWKCDVWCQHFEKNVTHFIFFRFWKHACHGKKIRTFSMWSWSTSVSNIVFLYISYHVGKYWQFGPCKNRSVPPNSPLFASLLKAPLAAFCGFLRFLTGLHEKSLLTLKGTPCYMLSGHCCLIVIASGSVITMVQGLSNSIRGQDRGFQGQGSKWGWVTERERNK